jgi:hypothetical protein
MQTNFHVTLLSNAQPELFENNRPDDFNTKLPHNIDLEGAWEVGVTQIQFHNHLKFYAPATQFVLWVFEHNANISVPEDPEYEANELETMLLDIGAATFKSYTMKHFFATIPGAYFETYKTYGNFVAKHLSKLCKSPVTYLSNGFTPNKFLITDKDKPNLRIGFSSKDAEAFETLGIITHEESNLLSNGVKLYGFDDHNAVVIKPKVPYPQNIFLYCNIVDKQIVGGSEVRLLKMLPAKTEEQKWQSHFFDTPTYAPVIDNVLSAINVFMRDEQGNAIRFIDTTSHVSLGLHFRKVGTSNQYFW